MAPATNPVTLDAEEANGSKKKLLAEDGAEADQEESQASTSDDNGSLTSGSTNNSASAGAMALEQARALIAIVTVDCLKPSCKNSGNLLRNRAPGPPSCIFRFLAAFALPTTFCRHPSAVYSESRGAKGWTRPSSSPPGAPPSAPSFQASIPTTSVAASPFPRLLGMEECPTRLQRASSPARTERIRAAGVGPVWSVGAGEGDEAEPCGGGTGLGTRGERALVEKLSMSGAQFLDLVVRTMTKSKSEQTCCSINQ